LPAGEANAVSEVEQELEQGSTNRTSQASISAALAAANAVHSTLASSVRFPGEDGGCSLAELAQRDLDVALQLLADRAQYITGANGAAIALRRSGKNDMQCRASTGANVPELGALLSTEFGLSGESVRTRQPLRCDDAERDPRVNREGCRQLGIASVVVMPVVNDDEVLGVFELFSGKVNAFGERDLSALQRLSEMVETAVKLARAAEGIPGQLMGAEVAATAGSGDEDVLSPEALVSETVGAETLGEEILGDQVLEVEADLAGKTESGPSAESAPLPAAPPTALPKKPLFWSVALSPVAEAEKAAEPDQSHVPPMLRNLRTCEACGFPVSAGRALCVECEEKKWRGQLKRPATPLGQTASPVSAPKSPAVDSRKSGAPAENVRNGAPALADAPSAPVARLVAAAAQSAAGVAAARQSALVTEAASLANSPTPATPTLAPSTAMTSATQAPSPEGRENESKGAAGAALATAVAAKPGMQQPVRETVSAASLGLPEGPLSSPSSSQSQGFVLSAGLAPSQSWLSANKYIVGALLVVAGTVAAIVFLR
jgi:hypothetical protein